jgi:phospholipid transport system substrate-binding protein
MIKRIVFIVLCWVITSFGVLAKSPEVSKENPYEMIQQVAEITFKRFADEQPKIRQNPNILKDIVREELLPYIDYTYAAYKVIGKNFSKTTREDRDQFVQVFRDYLVTAYAQVFTLYNNQKVSFEPAKPLGDEKIIAVNTIVSELGRPDINISFRLRYNKNTNEWKAFDMVAEGVSLLDSKQAELSTIIRQKGLPYVIELLKEKSMRDITFKTDKPEL